jgi:PAT family beta-lactamase induction signal transducer AmpG
MYGASLAESFCSGLAVTAFLSFCMRITEKEHAAVQYAVLSALFVLPGKLAGGVSGQVTQALGYAAWFALSGAITVPALLLLPFARRRLAWIEAQEA